MVNRAVAATQAGHYVNFQKKIRDPASRHRQLAIEHCPLISRKVNAANGSNGEQWTMSNRQLSMWGFC
jgi:hypothetical protein